MRRSLVCALIALGLSQPAAAQTVLYATAASSPGGIDVFRVRPDGSLEPDSLRRVQTGGDKPRRLLARGCNLYVAEKDRVEVYRVHSGARLELIGATKHTLEMQPHDIDLSPDGKMLYVPFRRQGTIASYPLDEEGTPSGSTIVENGVAVGSPNSCVYGSRGDGWEDIEVANGKLYAALVNRVDVFGILPDGRLYGAARIPADIDDDGDIDADDEDVDDDGDVDQDDRNQWDCPYWSNVPDPDSPLACIDPDVHPRPTRPVNSCPNSRRGHINGGTGLVVSGQSLFVEERFIHQVQGFALLADGNFPTTPPDAENPMLRPTKKQKKMERRSRKKNKTEETIRYIGLTFFQPTGKDPLLFGAGYKGRVDAFRLEDNPEAPGTWKIKDFPMSTTAFDFTTTPVRTVVANNSFGNPVLYVAAGELDRVQSYKLFPEGLIDPDANPEETSEQEGSYPNDVVLVDIASCD